jgi:6-phosphogluconolactonase
MEQILKEIVAFSTEEEMAFFASCLWNKIAQSAISEKGKFFVALSGGKTPLFFYNSLAASFFSWDLTQIFLTDERISRDTKESNYYSISKTLFEKISISKKSIHHIDTSLEIEKSVKKYEEELQSAFSLKNKEIPIFDLIILGIGTDGHVASLFSFEKTDRLVIKTEKKDIGQSRITITFPVINSAKNIIFFIKGKEKAPIVKTILKDLSQEYPASHVNSRNGKIYFLLDNEAACFL